MRKIAVLLLCGVCVSLTAYAEHSPSIITLLEFDRGTSNGERNFLQSDRCQETPCVITQDGAWKFSTAVPAVYTVTMQYMHGGALLPINIFQQSATFEQKLGERLLNRYPNRKIINLVHMVETGEVQTLYMYGIRLQYDIDEGDPFIIRFTHRKNPAHVFEYYFRYHHTGIRPDLDLAFLFPFPPFAPNPGGAIQNASRAMAFSLSAGSPMDPEQRYHVLRRLMKAVRVNLVMGVVDRSIVSDIAGDQVIKSSVDGFAGVGVTFFDFVLAGYGMNLFRAPRGGFPFVGIEVRHVFNFIRSLKKDTHSQWEKYLAAEQGRSSAARMPKKRVYHKAAKRPSKWDSF